MLGHPTNQAMPNQKPAMHDQSSSRSCRGQARFRCTGTAPTTPAVASPHRQRCGRPSRVQDSAPNTMHRRVKTRLRCASPDRYETVLERHRGQPRLPPVPCRRAGHLPKREAQNLRVRLRSPTPPIPQGIHHKEPRNHSQPNHRMISHCVFSSQNPVQASFQMNDDSCRHALNTLKWLGFGPNFRTILPNVLHSVNLSAH